MQPENVKKEITRKNQNNTNRKIDSENNKEEILGDNQKAINRKMKSENDKNEIIKRWNELLSTQPKALIHSTRSPAPLSPFIWFCLSKQQSIREELCRENPDITLTEISQSVALAWASLCAQDKLLYEKMASEKAQNSFDDGENKKRPSFEIPRPQEVSLSTSRYDDIEMRQGKKSRRLSKDVNENLATKSPELHLHFCSDGGHYDMSKQTLNTGVKIQKPSLQRQIKPNIEVASNATNISAISSSSNEIVQCMAGFKVFVQHIYPLVLNEYNYLSSEDAMRVLERVWSIMPAVEREHYVRIEHEEMAIRGADIHKIHNKN